TPVEARRGAPSSRLSPTHQGDACGSAQGRAIVEAQRKRATALMIVLRTPQSRGIPTASQAKAITPGLWLQSFSRVAAASVMAVLTWRSSARRRGAASLSAPGGG